MRILITNDDGISAPVLPKFIEWAKKLGEVTVVVPKHEQSGKSQAIDFNREVEIKQVRIVDGCESYTMDSTPADCVRFATRGLHRTYDIVFSGINRGYNLGHDIAYSGTVGAIMEAERAGLKAVAFSTDYDSSFDNALSELDGVYDYIVSNSLLATVGLLNVNIPPQKSRGISITRQGGMFYSDEFVSRGNDMYIQVGDPIVSKSGDLTVDINAIQNGYISISPLTSVYTDLEAYDRLIHLNER